jgi:hypothetical protein
VALVAIQKNPGADTGYGGTKGLEKPRLYLTIEEKSGFNVARIVKAKNKLVPYNLKNWEMRFQVIDGWDIVELGEWSNPYHNEGKETEF